MIEDIKNKVINMNEELAVIKKKNQEIIQKIVKEIFDKFHEKWKGQYRSIYWTQYTPYFNDGDECYFSVHDLNIAIREEDEADFPYGGFSEWYYTYYKVSENLS